MSARLGEDEGGMEPSTALHWAARTLCRQADQGVATLAQAADTHVHSELPRVFRTAACLQNCHVSSEMPLVFRTSIDTRVSEPPRVFRISVGGVGSLLHRIMVTHNTPGCRRAQNTGGRVGVCSG